VAIHYVPSVLIHRQTNNSEWRADWLCLIRLWMTTFFLDLELNSSILSFMLHLFHGKHKEHGDESYLENEFFGILVQYEWKKKKGTRYLHPQIDTNHNTIKYYAFDSHKQKDLFLELLKIQWIWGKNGYILACHDPKKLNEAIEEFDVKYFTSLPGIGPKTAKRILLEMKTSLGKEDVKKMSKNSKLMQDIVGQW